MSSSKRSRVPEESIEVTCHRKSGEWQVSVPDAPELALVVERLEDVPGVVRRALARQRKQDPADLKVLLDVRGT